MNNDTSNSNREISTPLPPPNGPTASDFKSVGLILLAVTSLSVLFSILIVFCAPAAAETIDLEGVKSETGDGPLTFGWNLLVYAGPVVLLTPLVKRLVDRKFRGRVADAKLPYAAAALGVCLLTLVWGAIDLLSKMLTGYSTDEVFPGGFGPAAASFIAVATAPGFLREATKPRDPSRMRSLEDADSVPNESLDVKYAESYDARARERGFLSDPGFISTRLTGLLAAAGLVAAIALSTAGCISPGAATPQEAAAVRGQAADVRQLQTAAGRDPRIPEVFVSAIDEHGDFLDSLANWLEGTAPFPHSTLPDPD